MSVIGFYFVCCMLQVRSLYKEGLFVSTLVLFTLIIAYLCCVNIAKKMGNINI